MSETPLLPPPERPVRHGPAEALRLFHTVRHLKPVQIYGRLWSHLALARPDCSPAPPLREPAGPWRLGIPRPASLFAHGRVRFLNEDGAVAGPSAWNDRAKLKLWLYNLHYFDDLASLGDKARRGRQCEWMARWIAENPPSKGVGWEPYPVSLRIANWIKWAFAGGAPGPEWCHSLATQTRWLAAHIEWHLLGNHLLANAKALVLAGLFFAGKEAETWLEAGLSIYAQQLPEQILADGGHFELSSMYHAIILEDLLDLINAARRYGRPEGDVFRGLPAITTRMRAWLAAMTHPDGDLSFFNDAAFGIAPRHAEIEAYVARLGLPALPVPGEGKHRLRASGYMRVNSADWAAILDLAAVGPDYLPGHAHADTLSFELSVGLERIIVNGGTSTYAPGPRRAAERATAAHSTVEIDGQNSSEVWASFRVARRALVRDLSCQKAGSLITIEAAHDGYRRLPGRPLHWRRWAFEDGSVTVTDIITPGEGHRALARFHLASGVTASRDPSGREGELITPAGRKLRWVATSPVHIVPSEWAAEFGLRIPTQTLLAPLEDGFLSMTLEGS
jgi:uncharacterized heparinase superfamily protein